jgi:hypothetical protein
MSRTPSYIFACVAAIGLASFAEAGSVQFQLGEQDFADGKTPIYSRQIRAAGAGEMFPFDGTIFGNDLKSGPTLGAFGYTHTIDLGGARAVSATLTVGLIDIDSPADAPLQTVSLSFDGFGQPADLLTGISAVNAKSSVEVVDIPVPVELLADGVLNVNVAALRPGYANLGNAIEADFSRLVVHVAPATPDNTAPPVIIPDPLPPTPIDPDDGGGPQPIPLPPALVPAALLIAGMAVTPKRRLRRWLRV